MSSFAQMKQNRQSQLANLTTELEKTQTVTSFVDDRIWKSDMESFSCGTVYLESLSEKWYITSTLPICIPLQVLSSNYF